jgi:hypothetical protein
MAKVKKPHGESTPSGSQFWSRQLLELVQSNVLQVGTTLYHPTRRYPERAVTAKVVAGGIYLKGRVYETPSGAAEAITGKAADGWFFWRIHPSGLYLDSLRPRRQNTVRTSK